jgi:hypothetical protein
MTPTTTTAGEPELAGRRRLVANKQRSRHAPPNELP